mmetsp:Transcript_32052/g.23691  ORF Transcript_32052/g.23691 Transcript_32052/m.23691 type:complete len:101 (-) Transcript_32052:90-392(-)
MILVILLDTLQARHSRHRKVSIQRHQRTLIFHHLLIDCLLPDIIVELEPQKLVAIDAVGYTDDAYCLHLHGHQFHALDWRIILHKQKQFSCNGNSSWTGF